MRREEVGRGLNRNAPVNGIRPDSGFSNVVEVVSDASARQRTLNLSYQIGGLPPPALTQNAPRIDWKRVFLIGQYTYGVWNNDFEGDFSPPPSGTLATEWGPSPSDARHRAFLTLIAQTLKNLQTQFNLNASSGLPYTIRTGLDDNGDLIFNDRPDGAGRNSVRGNAQWWLNAFVSYGLQFGKRRGGMPPGIRIINLNGAPQVDTVALDQIPRFRVQVYVQAQNLTNHYNYAGYNGSMTSPFFRLPTMVVVPRKIDIGLQFQF